MGHLRTALVLDLVQEPDDLAAPDFIDLPGAEHWIHEPLERGLARIGGAQLVALALEILFGDCSERVGRRAILPAPLGKRIAALGNGAERRLRLFPGVC